MTTTRARITTIRERTSNSRQLELKGAACCHSRRPNFLVHSGLYWWSRLHSPPGGVPNGASFAENENPARACVGQGRGLGNPPQAISSETTVYFDEGLRLGNTWARPRVPRGTSGTKSPQDTGSSALTDWTPRAGGRPSSITRAPCRKVMGVPGRRSTAAR
jgi:hypothetical protein